jgi:hypothetical protein
MDLNAYRAYGLCIHAEIACPELPLDPQPAEIPDVTIRLLSPVPSASESLETGYYEVQSGLFRLAVAGVGNFRIEEGSRISVEPVEGASLEQVRLFLLGSAMGALLYQRGLFPLHGSAVETRWGAMIFVGAQGVGKSTLAAHFYRRGYRLLSDDVCAVTTDSEKLQVLPALAQVRLCKDAYERLGQPQGGRFHIDKFIVPMNEGYCAKPVPLRAIHILMDREEGDPHFAVLRGFDRIQRLLENLYRPQFLKGQDTQGDLMRLAGLIAQKTTMVEVSRRRDPEAIENLVDILESAWAEDFSGIESGRGVDAPL